MGTDAQMYMQRKYWGSGDDWKTYDCPEYFKNRDYDFYSLLAGVRGNLEPIAEPRGLPHDFVPPDSYNPECDHDASWLSLKDMRSHLYGVPIDMIYEENPRALAYEKLAKLIEFLELWSFNKSDEDNIRIVFYFNS